MDNASKALVMVGAILIAVMLISLGVFLFTYARDAAEDQTGRIDELTVSAFNQQFNSYLGTNIGGSTVKALVSVARAAGVTLYNGDETQQINSLGKIEKMSQINSKSSYKVVEDYGGDGKISHIFVKENKED